MPDITRFVKANSFRYNLEEERINPDNRYTDQDIENSIDQPRFVSMCPKKTKRLMDEFVNSVPSFAIDLRNVEIVGAFADICWDANLCPYDLVQDPAFIINQASCYVAFQRIKEEIRYYAGCLPDCYEKQKEEIGILFSIDDMILFALQYFKGVSLQNISVKRKVIKC